MPRPLHQRSGEWEIVQTMMLSVRVHKLYSHTPHPRLPSFAHPRDSAVACFCIIINTQNTNNTKCLPSALESQIPRSRIITIRSLTRRISKTHYTISSNTHPAPLATASPSSRTVRRNNHSKECPSAKEMSMLEIYRTSRYSNYRSVYTIPDGYSRVRCLGYD